MKTLSKTKTLINTKYFVMRDEKFVMRDEKC